MTAEDGEDIAEMSSYRRVEFDGDMLSPSITRTAPEATGEFETDSPYEETVRSPHGLQQPTGRSEFGLSPSTTKSSKSIRLEPPPVVMRPPKVKDGGFGQAALSWISWYRNEETDGSRLCPMHATILPQPNHISIFWTHHHQGYQLEDV